MGSELFDVAAKMVEGKAAVEELAVRCGWFYRAALSSTNNQTLAEALTQQFFQALLMMAYSQNQKQAKPA